MSLIKCPECGAMISDHATECPKCGYPLKKSEEYVETIENPIAEDDDQKPKSKTWLVILLAIALLACVGGSIYYYTTRGGAATRNNAEVTDSDSIVKADSNNIVAKEEKPEETTVYITDNSIGSIRKGMLASKAVPMILDKNVKGEFYNNVKAEIAKNSLDPYEFDDNIELVLCKGKERMASIILDDSPNYDDTEAQKLKKMANYHITGFRLLSKDLKLKDGIHVGMTAKELVEKYKAKIHYFANPETGGIEFFIPGYDNDTYKFVASGDVLNEESIPSRDDDGNIDENGDYIDEMLTLSQVKNCKLIQIKF